jgi:ribosomal protein L11
MTTETVLRDKLADFQRSTLICVARHETSDALIEKYEAALKEIAGMALCVDVEFDVECPMCVARKALEP